MRCDCGFEVSADGTQELVDVAQDHARETHGMDLPAELVLALARAAAWRPGTTETGDGKAPQ